MSRLHSSQKYCTLFCVDGANPIDFNVSVGLAFNQNFTLAWRALLRRRALLRMLTWKPFSSGADRLFRNWLRLGCFAAAVILTAWPCRTAAATPVISLIQRFSTNQVVIHFDTDANRTYTLQYANSLPRNGAATWATLYTAPNLPFPNHYVVNDFRTTRQRFYRLKVTP